MTTTRSGTATNDDSTQSPQVVSVAANTGRYHSVKGLLSEASATNLALRSETLTDTASWTADSNSTADTATAPDGTLTMDTVSNLALTNAKAVYQTAAVTSSVGPFNHAIYAKAKNASDVASVFISCGGNTIASCSCAVSSGTCATANFVHTHGNSCAAYSTVTSTTVRLQVTATCNAARVSIGFGMSGGQLGTSMGEAYFWGSQFAEATATATSYIRTTTAAVTRSADVHTVPTTGWPTTSGEVSLRYTALSSAAPATQYSLFDSRAGAAVSGVNVRRMTTNALFLQIFDGSGLICTTTSSALTWAAEKQIEVRWSPAGCEIVADGVSVASSGTGGSMTAHNATAWIGTDRTGTLTANGWIRDMCVARQGGCP